MKAKKTARAAHMIGLSYAERAETQDDRYSKNKEKWKIKITRMRYKEKKLKNRWVRTMRGNMQTERDMQRIYSNIIYSIELLTPLSRSIPRMWAVRKAQPNYMYITHINFYTF